MDNKSPTIYLSCSPFLCYELLKAFPQNQIFSAETLEESSMKNFTKSG